MNDKKRSMPDYVAKYLRDYPDFLINHPEILESLELPHESGAAVSLIEKQVQRLRQQNKALNKQLQQLIQVATDNEQLMNRLHKLTLDLMSIDDIKAFFEHLCTALNDEFNADVLNISLFDRKIECAKDTPVYFLPHDDSEMQMFQSQLDKGDTVCGRFNRNKLDFLFGSRANWVQSTTLVPLGEYGFLAIGSSDPARFYPGMGTLFLDLLSSVITHRLAETAPQKHRRTA